jgi:hypothetical protein
MVAAAVGRALCQGAGGTADSSATTAATIQAWLTCDVPSQFQRLRGRRMMAAAWAAYEKHLGL